MITIGPSFFKKLSVLLGVLLCCILLVATPFVTHAAPFPAATTAAHMDGSEDLPFAKAGKVASGDSEAVLQFDEILLVQIVQNLPQRNYPLLSGSTAVPAFYAFSKGDGGLNSILTKGP